MRGLDEIIAINNDAAQKQALNKAVGGDINAAKQAISTILSAFSEEDAGKILADALAGAFVWHNTAQGHNYWEEVWVRLANIYNKSQELDPEAVSLPPPTDHPVVEAYAH
jgi:hypothetical protein